MLSITISTINLSLWRDNLLFILMAIPFLCFVIIICCEFIEKMTSVRN